MILIGCEALCGLLAGRGVSFQRTHGVCYFHGCYSIGDDTLWGVNRGKKGAVNSFWSRAACDDYKALVESHGCRWDLVHLRADRMTLERRLEVRSGVEGANAVTVDGRCSTATWPTSINRVERASRSSCSP